MDDTRTKILLGDDLKKIQLKTIAIIGLGRVGSYLLETLSRIGFKRFIVVDNGELENSSNVLYTGIKISKAEAAKKRIDEINEDAEVVSFNKPYDKKMLEGADIIANTLPAPYCFDVLYDAKEIQTEIITGYNLKYAYNPKEIKLEKIKKLTSLFPEFNKLIKVGLGEEKILFSTEKEENIYYPSLSGLVFAAELVGALICAETEN